jgi:hypothetical protein
MVSWDLRSHGSQVQFARRSFDELYPDRPPIGQTLRGEALVEGLHGRCNGDDRTIGYRDELVRVAVPVVLDVSRPECTARLSLPPEIVRCSGSWP